MEKLAIVIVTFKRQQLLDQLLDSLLYLQDAPWRVIVVDNENSADAANVVELHRRLVGQGLTAVPWPDGAETFVYVPMSENTGGACGFAKGVRQAFRLGAEWFWLMDDDVTVMPDAVAKLSKWAGPFDVVQGSRLDYDGGPFYWQNRFIEPLGMYHPLAPSGFDGSGYKPTNTMCFEGGLFSRGIVERAWSARRALLHLRGRPRLWLPGQQGWRVGRRSGRDSATDAATSDHWRGKRGAGS